MIIRFRKIRPMPAKLRNPRQALGDYLNDMLHQATSELAEKPIIKNRQRLLLPGELLQAATESAAQAETEQVASQQTGRSSAATDDKPRVAVDDSDVAQELTAADEPPQVRAALEFPMQCLMFRVGGHLLSIPLIQLSSVVNWNQAITRLPESPDWLLGLVKHRDLNLRIVDSRLLLNIKHEGNQQPEHLLVLDDGGWAITCDHLEQVVNLDYEEIQWRPADAGQLVLGTIRKSLSTLLNPPGITRLLNERDSATVEP